MKINYKTLKRCIHSSYGLAFKLQRRPSPNSIKIVPRMCHFGYPSRQLRVLSRHCTKVRGLSWMMIALLSTRWDSVDSMRRCSELGIETGKQKRSKEIMNWARKKRRMIRREDLLAYLAGKPPPPRPHSHRSSPKPRMMVCGSSPSQSPTQSMGVSQTSSPGIDLDPELHTFREAISLSGSSVSRRSGKQAELTSFINSEFARHHKRPASHDVDMGSPTHKRSRHM
ncbi:PREDICTED: UPF0472 protein C16orf72 homolog isoform X2 [Polistes dominula]|uniref:UPF0472 protein C16orf72 homolog isoform X2 n=1 Tax=Polistes dominula TaxID=743375 RepID=A0ABM1IPW9_POLDO|nr:PREDICTED: UPF0472 protein C16orf72 homolog isoform X2 [Polistes dominula]